jgi:hypothetical protein
MLRARAPTTSLGQRPHRPALVAVAGPERAGVVHPGEEDGAEHDPEKAGTQPQITAIAGPTMGAAPATEVKWWPQSTNLLVGT